MCVVVVVVEEFLKTPSGESAAAPQDCLQMRTQHPEGGVAEGHGGREGGRGSEMSRPVHAQDAPEGGKRGGRVERGALF